MNEVLTNEDVLHLRVYLYPTSAIKQNGKEINYRDFLMSAEYEGCNEAVKRIVPRIDRIRAVHLLRECRICPICKESFTNIMLRRDMIQCSL